MRSALMLTFKKSRTPTTDPQFVHCTKSTARVVPSRLLAWTTSNWLFPHFMQLDCAIFVPPIFMSILLVIIVYVFWGLIDSNYSVNKLTTLYPKKRRPECLVSICFLFYNSPWKNIFKVTALAAFTAL